MQAEIITIGDEILIGQIVDSNSAFLAKSLNKIGIEVSQITSVSDQEQAIISAMENAQKRVSLVLLTGGLGPTKDDITKTSFCKFFDDHLVHNQDILDHIEKLFTQYLNVPINDLNREQAMLPSRAVILENRFGTAVGMWMEKKTTVFVALPGIPYEMKSITDTQLIPKLKTHFKRPVLIHKTMMTYGWGESRIAEVIHDWEAALPSHINLAYLPNLGRVRLRLTARGENEDQLQKEIDQQFEALYTLIGDIITGFEGDRPIEAQIGSILTEKQLSIAVAESCTGGRIAALLSSIPGASAYFFGGIVAYKTSVKSKVLGVSEELIASHSIVSEEVALAMAKGVRKQMKSDYAIATTGNAGPTKGDSDAEIGTVCIALVGPDFERVESYYFGKNREKIVQKAVNKALELARKMLM